MRCTNCGLALNPERHSWERFIEHPLPNGIVALIELTTIECPQCDHEEMIEERMIKGKIGDKVLG